MAAASLGEATGRVDHRRVDWSTVRWTAYLIHQRVRYEYPGRVRDLRQQLVIVPPERHGGQRLVTHRLEVSSPAAEVRHARDEFGNQVIDLFVGEIDEAIDFTAWIVVEREARAAPPRLPSAAAARFREPSGLTMPDEALRAAAHDLAGAPGDGRARAALINAWVHEAMTYTHGLTGVRTSAAEAFALRRGVCQDYAHIMLALCRLCDIPARYVSGHLLGEGATHAWVEVLLPDPERPDTVVAEAFDPTHGVRPGLNYITVAVGRDYRDVAPTSGTYRAPYTGRLHIHKRAEITALEHFAP